VCCDNGVICWRAYVPSSYVPVWWRIYTSCSTTIPGTFSGNQGNSVRQLIQKFKEPVPSVMLPDLVGHQHWQRRKYWISQTACSKVRRSPSRTYPSRLVSHMARSIQLKKRIRLHPYKITAVHELKPGDSAKRVAYCKWFLDFLDGEGEDSWDVTFFTDEAYFHLSGYINSQNSRVWCAHNPTAFHDSPLHDEKIGVWVGM